MFLTGVANAIPVTRGDAPGWEILPLQGGAVGEGFGVFTGVANAIPVTRGDAPGWEISLLQGGAVGEGFVFLRALQTQLQ